MGLAKPASGRVFLFDEDVTNMPESGMFAIRSKLGMLFQESALFDSMTVAQNVAYPLLNQKIDSDAAGQDGAGRTGFAALR